MEQQDKTKQILQTIITRVFDQDDDLISVADGNSEITINEPERPRTMMEVDFIDKEGTSYSLCLTPLE